MRFPPRLLPAGLFRAALDAAGDVLLPFTFAHLARCASAIRSRASGDMVRLPFFLEDVEAAEVAVEAPEPLSPLIFAHLAF